jgi:hypothetical protein
MQLRKMALMFAAMGVVLAGCPGPDENETCSTNADCLDSEICNPAAGVCMATCNLAADCPDTAKNCEALGGTGPDAATKVCKCATGVNQCNLGRQEDDRVCSPDTGVCVTKCTMDTDCTTGTCDTATGLCKTQAQDCVANPNLCTGGQVCNQTTKQCETPQTKTCNPANQPDVCSYSQICSSTNNTCVAAPEGTCTEATASGAPTWNKAAGAAPVIVSATAQRLNSTDATDECAQGAAAGLITIRFYAPGGLTTHTTFSDLQNHVRFRVANSGQFFGANFARQRPTANAVEGTMQIGIGCGNSTETASIYLANEAGQTSNVVCVSW